MNNFGLMGLRTGRATVELVDIPGGVKIVFAGDIDVVNPESHFTPFFDSLHDKMTRNRVRYVEMDLMNLTFLNSSGIKTILKWLNVASKLPPDQKYKIKVLSNSQIFWQDMSVKMFSLFAKDIVDVLTV